MLHFIVPLALLFALANTQTPPQWPPAQEFAVNITYTPGFYEYNEDMSGAYYFSAKVNKYAIDSKDPLRTYERIVFLEDSSTQYVVSKFGMFLF